MTDKIELENEISGIILLVTGTEFLGDISGCSKEIIHLVTERVKADILEIVLKEPDYISSSQSTRQGYVRAVNDMRRAIEKA